MKLTLEPPTLETPGSEFPPPPLNRRMGDILRGEFHRIRLLAINYSLGSHLKELTLQLFPAYQRTELPILEHLCAYRTLMNGSLHTPRFKSLMITAGVDCLWPALKPDTVVGLCIGGNRRKNDRITYQWRHYRYYQLKYGT
ncbi:hypothetical protein M422DRAFT_40660 [Sphaerobolus stellatus SS14]|nr:hypothetical protein M422DRAFT_40660 [Sphaerobolus stellatus SS14]